MMMNPTIPTGAIGEVTLPYSRTIEDFKVRARNNIDHVLENARRYERSGQYLADLSKLVDVDQLIVDDPIFAAHLLQGLGHENSNPERLLNWRDVANRRCGDITGVMEAHIEKTRKLISERVNFILDIDTSTPRLENIEALAEIVEGRRGHLEFDFLAIKNLIEKAYGVHTNNVFGDLRVQEDKYEFARKTFGFTKEEAEFGAKQPPMTGDEFAVIAVIQRAYLEDVVPYVDHWHHLLDYDFHKLRRGGTNYMQVSRSDAEGALFAKFREIYVAECKAHPGVSAEAEEIAFMIDW